MAVRVAPRVPQRLLMGALHVAQKSHRKYQTFAVPWTRFTDALETSVVYRLQVRAQLRVSARVEGGVQRPQLGECFVERRAPAVQVAREGRVGGLQSR
jgi:hypothetical protein